jgi:lipopolysaccharide export system protein LptA
MRLLALTTILATAPPPLDIQADRLDFDRVKNTATFEGNVQLKRNDLTLTCDRLTATWTPDGALTGLDLQGHLTLKSATLEARAERARLTDPQGELLLTGQPELTRGPDRLTGELIRVWPETGRVVIEKARGRLHNLRAPPKP